MSFRQTVFALALVSASFSTAFANSGGAVLSEERGYEFNHASQSTKSRTDVLKELESSQKASVASMNGPLALSRGNRGYMNEQHSLAVQNGRLVHTDNLSHDSPKPSLAMTAEERRQSQQLYRN